MYTSASENVHLCLRTVNWVTLVSLLVEYLLYSVVLCCRALSAGSTRPLLVRPADQSFPDADLCAILGALHAVYVVSVLNIRIELLFLEQGVTVFFIIMCYVIYYILVMNLIIFVSL